MSAWSWNMPSLQARAACAPEDELRACRNGRCRIPTLPIEKGRPGPALLAHVLVSKCAIISRCIAEPTLPGRSGVRRSTAPSLAGRVGHMAALWSLADQDRA